MSFAQRRDYFQCLKLADWQQIITHIQSFLKGWTATKHLWALDNDPRLVFIIPQLMWVMCVIQLWCYCARAAALAESFQTKHQTQQSVHCVLEGRGTRRWRSRERSFVLRFHRKTQRQKWEKATGDNLDGVALSPWRWLFEDLHWFFKFDSGPTRYFNPQLSTMKPYKVLRRRWINF